MSSACSKLMYRKDNTKTFEKIALFIVYVCLCTMHVQEVQGGQSDEGIRSLGTGITSSFQSPSMGSRN